VGGTARRITIGTRSEPKNTTRIRNTSTSATIMERKRFLKLSSMSWFSPPTCALTLPGNETSARAF
jgi:hypothetical protein